MKVLVVSALSPDYVTSCLWDGLQEVLGEENVYDRYSSPWLHYVSAREQPKPHPTLFSCVASVCDIGASRPGVSWYGEDGFDLLVIHSCFRRDRHWQEAWENEKWLRPGGKIAYVEGWDAAWQVHAPEGRVDAVFRKEIEPGYSYPYHPIYLTYAAPSRWVFNDFLTRERPCDLFFSGNPNSSHPNVPIRWPALGQVFQTKRMHNSFVSTFGMDRYEYMQMLRKSKLALCPSGADLTDTMRGFEAAACGAIPVLVGYPNYVRDDWWDGLCSFRCAPHEVASVLDEALANDLAGRRAALLERVQKHHTTAARARKFLEAVL